MFTDPQVITVNAVAKSMPRISVDGASAIYQMPDESYKFTISHQKTKDRIRTMVRVDQRAVVADPITAVNDWETLTSYHVIDRPAVGFSMVQVEQQVAALCLWLTNANVDKLYGGES